MKTIIHLVLSDEERSNLANWIDNKFSKRMVSRDEVSHLCQEHIHGLLQGGRGAREIRNELNKSHTDVGRGPSVPESPIRRGGDGIPNLSDPVSSSVAENDISPGGAEPESEEPKWESLPGAAELADACRSVLAHLTLEGKTDTINIGWCCSTLLQTGVR